jgi:hypothetical protein
MVGIERHKCNRSCGQEQERGSRKRERVARRSMKIHHASITQMGCQPSRSCIRWRGSDSPLLGAPRAVHSEGLSSVRGSSLPGAPESLRSPLPRGKRREASVAERQLAREWDACRDCETRQRPHWAHGRCKRCDDRWRYAHRAHGHVEAAKLRTESTTGGVPHR